MSFSVTEPSSRQKWFAGTLVILYALITLVPLVWITMTGFKTPPDSISYPPKVTFEPSLEGYVNLFTTRTRVSKETLANLPEPDNFADRIVRNRGMVIAGPSKFGQRFMNSVIIGFGSTFLSIFLGTLAAYAFSRFQNPAGGRSAVLYPVNADDAAHRCGHPDFSDVPVSRFVRYPPRHDPAVHGCQYFTRGLVAQGFYR